jgi:cell wall-associated NlpC family hydrolase
MKREKNSQPPPFANNKSKRILGVILAVLFFTNCSARTEPDEVWNLRDKMISLAESLVGIPYKYGGYDIEGFDCSGFVYYVYDCFGIELPRSARTLANRKDKIKLTSAKPADILVFKMRRRWHAALYLGSSIFIHAPNHGGAIRKESLNNFWKNRLKCVLRVIPN